MGASTDPDAAGTPHTGKRRVGGFSARVSAPDYLRLFGRRFGSSPPTNLPIPKELAEYVESVTVAPQHEYF